MRNTMFCVMAVALLCIANVVQAGPWKPLWTVPLPSPPGYPPVAAASKNLYFTADANSTVWAIDSVKRSVSWSLIWDNVQGLYAFPAQDTLLVVVGTGIWSVAASTGKLRWANNSMVVGTNYAPQTSGNWFIAQMTIGNSGNTNTLVCIDPLTGDARWLLPSANAFFLASDRVVTTIDSSSITPRVAVYSLIDGTMQWQNQGVSLLGAGNGIVVTLNTTLSNQATLVLFDVVSGKQKAALNGLLNYTVESPASVAAFLEDGKIVVTDVQYNVVAIDNVTFNVLWHTNLASIPSLHNFGVNTFVVSPSSIIAVSNVNSSANGDGIALFNITSLSRRTGQTAWALIYPPTIGSSGGAPVQTAGSSYIIVPNLIGCLIVSQISGNVLLRSENNDCPIVAGTQVTMQGVLIALDGLGSVSAYPA